jgi:hypothetical protein
MCCGLARSSGIEIRRSDAGPIAQWLFSIVYHLKLVRWSFLSLVYHLQTFFLKHPLYLSHIRPRHARINQILPPGPSTAALIEPLHYCGSVLMASSTSASEQTRSWKPLHAACACRASSFPLLYQRSYLAPVDPRRTSVIPTGFVSRGEDSGRDPHVPPLHVKHQLTRAFRHDTSSGEISTSLHTLSEDNFYCLLSHC